VEVEEEVEVIALDSDLLDAGYRLYTALLHSLVFHRFHEYLQATGELFLNYKDVSFIVLKLQLTLEQGLKWIITQTLVVLVQNFPLFISQDRFVMSHPLRIHTMQCKTLKFAWRRQHGGITP
jgi:hypothetical protein